MTPKEFAARISGRQYGSEITQEEKRIAKDNGLTIVFGQSDDLMEFRGAINDEEDCYEGGIAYLDRDGLFVHACDADDCPYAAREREKCKTIEAVWHDGGDPAWAYVTDIPHAVFNIYEGHDLYCAGIVFEMAALNHDAGVRLGDS